MFKKISSFILPLIIASTFIINMIQSGEPCCIINGKIVKFTTYPKTSNSSLYLSETEEQAIHKLWLSLTTQKNKTINQPSIGIVTLTTPDRTMFTSITLQAIRKYCSLWGYKYHEVDHTINTERQPAWSKITATKKIMLEHPEYEWVTWIDDDIILTNPTISLDYFLQLCSNQHKELIISEALAIEDGIPLNSGILIVKNTKKMRDFLDEIWIYGGEKEYFAYPSLLEQQAMTELIRDSKTISDLIQIIPVGILQSYLGHPHHPTKVQWQPHHFAGHMNALDYTTRKNILHSQLAVYNPFNLQFN